MEEIYEEAAFCESGNTFTHDTALHGNTVEKCNKEKWCEYTKGGIPEEKMGIGGADIAGIVRYFVEVILD